MVHSGLRFVLHNINEVMVSVSYQSVINDAPINLAVSLNLPIKARTIVEIRFLNFVTIKFIKVDLDEQPIFILDGLGEVNSIK